MIAGSQQGVGAPRRPALLRFILAGLLAPGLLAIFSYFLGREYLATEQLRHEARMAFTIRSETASIIDRICEAESNERGYVLTGDTAYLRVYRAAQATALKAFDHLDASAPVSVAETAARATLHRLALRKFAEMDTVIETRRTRGLADAAALVRNGAGKSLMEELQRVSDSMLARARQARDMQADRYGRRVYADMVQTFIAIGAVGALLLVAAVAIWWQRLSQYRTNVAAFGIAERNRAILDNTVDGIIIFDPNGTVETANAAAAQMLGYGPDELVGRDVGMLVKMADRPMTFHQRIGLVDGTIARPHLPDRKVLHRDGHSIPVDIALGVIRSPDGDHVVAAIHNLTARKRIETMKDELISTVSHELRTPITSIVGALGLLRSGATGAIDPASARLIEIAENNSRRLIRLINDILDIDRIQSGQWKFASDRIDLSEVVDRACEGSQGQAGAAEVEIECLVPDRPVEVSGDAERLLQVLGNLTANAIRVSTPGQKVRIGVSTSKNEKAIITVDDDGPGIPVEFRDRIFGRFERADRGHGVGAGLGLAISREIVLRHGGRIWFEDRPGGGTRFAFSLDLLAAPEIATTASHRSRLLICEDDADIAETLQLMVDAMGYDADCVGTVAAARLALQGGGYRILLLDMQLPDETGASLLRSLRAPDGTLPLPVVVISGGTSGRSHALFQSGIIDWIEKPVDARRLATALQAAAARSRVAA